MLAAGPPTLGAAVTEALPPLILFHLLAYPLLDTQVVRLYQETYYNLVLSGPSLTRAPERSGCLSTTAEEQNNQHMGPPYR